MSSRWSREAFARFLGETKLIEQSENPRLAYQVGEAARLLGVGRSTIFKLLKERRLRRARIGTLVLIPRAEIERLLAEASTDA